MESTLTSPRSTGARAAWAVLRGDFVFWLAMSVLVIAVVPYVVPLLDPEQFRDWRYIYVDIPVSLAALIAISVGIRRLRRSFSSRSRVATWPIRAKPVS